jgi:Putative addiction module component.
MSTIIELEKEILALSPAERERLATIAWESLFSDPDAAGNRAIDPEGIQLAAQRNADVEAGKVKPIDHAEFRKRTGGTPE